jgi:hypothetical protein
MAHQVDLVIYDLLEAVRARLLLLKGQFPGLEVLHLGDAPQFLSIYTANTKNEAVMEIHIDLNGNFYFRSYTPFNFGLAPTPCFHVDHSSASVPLNSPQSFDDATMIVSSWLDRVRAAANEHRRRIRRIHRELRSQSGHGDG